MHVAIVDSSCIGFIEPFYAIPSSWIEISRKKHVLVSAVTGGGERKSVSTSPHLKVWIILIKSHIPRRDRRIETERDEQNHHHADYDPHIAD
jgi:hypothetical protein